MGMTPDRRLNKRQAKMIQEIGRAARAHGVDLPLPSPPDWRGPICWLMLVAALALSVYLFLFAATVCGAPTPVYREPKPLRQRIVGEWKIVWGGSEGACHLGLDGFWGCSLGECRWEGDWSLMGDTLTIRERMLKYPDRPLTTYTIPLDPAVRQGAKGFINGGISFALRR